MKPHSMALRRAVARAQVQGANALSIRLIHRRALIPNNTVSHTLLNRSHLPNARTTMARSNGEFSLRTRDYSPSAVSVSGIPDFAFAFE